MSEFSESVYFIKKDVRVSQTAQIIRISLSDRSEPLHSFKLEQLPQQQAGNTVQVSSYFECELLFIIFSKFLLR